MAQLNSSHHSDGGVLLYSGELVLLYCDKVNCEIDGVGNATGRMFLTTHRIVFTAQPIYQNSQLQSLAAPFYAMFDLGLEQPVFGSNYIRGKVRTNSNQNTSPLTQNQFIFKLRFNKGGAIEFGRALTNAAKQASQIASQSGFNNYAFTTTAAAGQYYRSPADIYQPNYPVGFILPTNTFNEVPQSGTIYYQESPPPYPGIVPAHQMRQPPAFSPYAQVYPTQPVNSVYESNQYQGQYQTSNPQQQYPTVHYPSMPPGQEYPQFNQQAPPYAYGQQAPPAYQPNNPAYSNQSNTGYPNQPNTGYPNNPQMGYQPQSTNNQTYPPLQQMGYQPQSANNQTYPNIPSYSDVNRNEKQ